MLTRTHQWTDLSGGSCFEWFQRCKHCGAERILVATEESTRLTAEYYDGATQLEAAPRCIRRQVRGTKKVRA